MNGSREHTALRTILWAYILLCLAIASLNWGYVPSAPKRQAELVTRIWQIYENWGKMAVILACGILTLRIKRKKQRTTMTRLNIIGFTLAALAIHVLLPALSRNPEIYLFAMPLPWNTAPLQAGIEHSTFYRSQAAAIGTAGIRWALTFFWTYSACILVATLAFGRRVQCSTLCLFNGFAAEVFDPVIPLARKSVPRPKKGTLAFLSVLRWVFFAVSAGFACFWILLGLGMDLGSAMEAARKAETYKYLLTELLMAMFFWVAFIGRGYCHYCPLGTLLGLVSRMAGQRIETDKATCIQCGKCSAACPMSIDVKAAARDRKPVSDIRCVGCGHCIDACPTETLAYRTNLLALLYRARSIDQSQETLLH
jgi:polyferredoxin